MGTPGIGVPTDEEVTDAGAETAVAEVAAAAEDESEEAEVAEDVPASMDGVSRGVSRGVPGLRCVRVREDDRDRERDEVEDEADDEDEARRPTRPLLPPPALRFPRALDPARDPGARAADAIDPCVPQKTDPSVRLTQQQWDGQTTRVQFNGTRVTAAELAMGRRSGGRGGGAEALPLPVKEFNLLIHVSRVGKPGLEDVLPHGVAGTQLLLPAPLGANRVHEVSERGVGDRHGVTETLGLHLDVHGQGMNGFAVESTCKHRVPRGCIQALGPKLPLAGQPREGLGSIDHSLVHVLKHGGVSRPCFVFARSKRLRISVSRVSRMRRNASCMR
jgi:hypothetical protein